LSAGNHSLSVSYADPAGNYAASSTTGTLVVNKAPLTVTAAGVNKVYDGTTSAAVALADNRVAGDNLTVSYTSAAFADSNPGTGKTVSVSGISISGAASGNYQLANVTATTTAGISKATLTVTAAGASKVYGSANPAFTSSFSGFVNGQTLATSGVSGSASLSS